MMNNKQSISTLAKDMRALYHLMYERSDYRSFISSREKKHMDRRHIVRYLVKRERQCSLAAVAEAESYLTKTKPVNHATIINSLEAVQDGLNDRYKDLIHQLGFFYDAWIKANIGSFGMPYLGRIAEFKKEQDHVKDILLASLVQHGLVSADIVQIMLNEYRHVDRSFLEKLMAKGKYVNSNNKSPEK